MAVWTSKKAGHLNPPQDEIRFIAIEAQKWIKR